MKKIAIVKPDNTFLPEAHAYKKYAEKHHFFSVDIIPHFPKTGYDAVFIFYGIYPFWKNYGSTKIIGEYCSLSIGRFPKFKDLLKRAINVKPAISVALNQRIASSLCLPKKTVFRSMGYFPNYIKKQQKNKIYDIVYAGTIERSGVLDALNYLASLGFKVCVIGSEQSVGKNIISIGKVSLEKVYDLYSQSNYGLNYIPDEYPYNIQDSTKIIEYCAAGLKIITNRYEWVNRFEEDNKAKFLSYESISSKNDIEAFDFITPDITKYTWDNIIKSSNIFEKLQNII